MQPPTSRPTRVRRIALAGAVTALTVTAAGAAIAPSVQAEASPTPTSAVGVLIETAPAKYQTQCVPWRSGMSGADVLKAVANVSWGTGKLAGFVLKIDGVGKNTATNTQYWSYYHDTGTGWAYASTGPLDYHAKPGTVEGWVWVNGKDVKPPTVKFSQVCAASANASPATGAAGTATAGGTATAATKAKSSDSNTGAVVGTVIGVAAVVILGGGTILFRRRARHPESD